MNKNTNIEIDTSLLISYAHGHLAPDLSFIVKNALELDEDLRLEYQGIVLLIKEYPEKDPEDLLDEMLGSLNRKINTPSRIQGKNTGRVVRLWKPLLVAASVILIAGFGLLFKWQTDRNNPVLLAQQIVAEASFEGDSRGLDTVAVTWQDAFKQENFESVIRTLKDKNKLNHTEQFYLGVSYLKLSPPQAINAEPVLVKATTSGFEHRDDAWLYLGIALIFQNKNKEAIQRLDNIKVNPYAAELLARLRK